MNEFEVLKHIRASIPKSLQSQDMLSDDTAILRGVKGKKLLLTTDMLVEGVDFIRKQAKPEWVGRKALAVSLSDIAAMGGAPYACVVSLGLPKNISRTWVPRFYKGLSAIAKKYNTLCVGGDLSSSKEICISVALIGYAEKPTERKCAKGNDWIGVTGKLGGSILKKHFLFDPRVKEADLIQSCKPSAMIDVSDGFAQDLEHILKLSKTGAMIWLEKIPVSQDALKLAKKNQKKALQRALTDGEDFELLFSISTSGKVKLDKKWKRNFPKVPLSWVGRIKKDIRKVEWYEGEKRVKNPIGKMKGYQHYL